MAIGPARAKEYLLTGDPLTAEEAHRIAFDASTGYEMVTMLSEDHDEAVAAFKEKRTPRFEGR